MRLGVLDQSPVPEGSTGADALAASIRLARATERLGYERFWLAEHHNTLSLAGTAPEILAACVAAATTTIRVGAGGVLLSYYRALKVAESFRVLEALFPGRIDLGLGRAPGTDGLAAAALGDEPGRQVATAPAGTDDDYPARVADLVGFLHDRLPAEHRFGGVRAMPVVPTAPEVWVLGSSSYGSELAAAAGLPFSFAHFVSPRFGPQVVAAYRRRFSPSDRCRAARVSVGVSVVCAESDAAAERLVISDDLWHRRPEGGERPPLLSVADAEVVDLSEVERALMAQRRDRRIVGAPDRVRSALLALASTYGVDELIVRTVTHDPAARLRSYELLAAAFDLGGSDATPVGQVRRR